MCSYFGHIFVFWQFVVTWFFSAAPSFWLQPVLSLFGNRRLKTLRITLITAGVWSGVMITAQRGSVSSSSSPPSVRCSLILWNCSYEP